MSITNLRDSLNDEVSTILSSDFTVNISGTNAVPHSDDVGITFPNLDEKRQSCKLIDTCILYIDIRRSTELNLTHRQHTVARLYSAFVRAMTRAARHANGHVRGIIGDRVMVIFDSADAFIEAVDCAILMNSVSQYVINKHFKANEVTCGIGIDAGKMLVTKTGIRKNGQERHNYRNLVWLGRPANVASKLTDLANKPAETVVIPSVHAAFQTSSLFDDFNWQWRGIRPADFVQQIETWTGSNGVIRHKDPKFRSMFMSTETLTVKDKTPPILMTRAVYAGYKAANPDADAIAKGWIKRVQVKVPGFTDVVFGGDIIKTAFRP